MTTEDDDDCLDGEGSVVEKLGDCAGDGESGKKKIGLDE